MGWADYRRVWTDERETRACPPRRAVCHSVRWCWTNPNSHGGMASELPAADAVARLLRNGETRIATLEAEKAAQDERMAELEARLMALETGRETD